VIEVCWGEVRGFGGDSKLAAFSLCSAWQNKKSNKTGRTRRMKNLDGSYLKGKKWRREKRALGDEAD